MIGQSPQDTHPAGTPHIISKFRRFAATGIQKPRNATTLMLSHFIDAYAISDILRHRRHSQSWFGGLNLPPERHHLIQGQPAVADDIPDMIRAAASVDEHAVGSPCVQPFKQIFARMSERMMGVPVLVYGHVGLTDF